MKKAVCGSLYQLEGLEPRIMLSAEPSGLGGVVYAVGDLQSLDEVPSRSDDSTASLAATADLYEPAVGDLFPVSETQPLSSESFADFPGAASGIANGLDAIGNWAGQIGHQSIPGADQITINAPNLSNPNLTRSINFFHAPVLPGGLYQLSIDGSLYEVTMGGAISTPAQIANAFAQQINLDGEFGAQVIGSQLNLLPGNPDLGTIGAGDLDILLSSWRDWSVFNQTLPLIDLDGYWAGLEELIMIPDFAYGSIAEMMDFGNVLSTHLTTPLANFLNANPMATLDDFLNEIRGLGAEIQGLDFIIDVDGLLGEYLFDPTEGIEELLFTIPLQYIRGPPAYDLDLGKYAEILGFSLSDLTSAMELPFDVIVEMDLIFGYDLRAGILDPFFMRFSEDGIRARVEGLLDQIDTSLLVGFLDTIVEAGTLEFDFEIAFNWHESVLSQGRIYYNQLLAVMGEWQDVLNIEVLEARFEALLPLFTDFLDVLLPGQIPQIRFSAEDFLNRLPEIELIDFGRLEDFLALTPDAFLAKLLELGDTLRLLVDVDAFADLLLPFSKDLDFGQLMDLPELYINQFMELFRVDEAWVFGDLQWFIDQMEDYVVEAEFIQSFDFVYAPADQRIEFTFEFETGLDIGEALFGFSHSAGPISIVMSNSFFEISGNAGMKIGLSVDLTAPVVSVEAAAGFTLPTTGILPQTALIEILLENGALTDGSVVEVSVASNPGNVSLEDLLFDINTALAASLLGGMIQARLEDGQFVFENSYTSAAPSFLIKAPELIGHEHFQAATEPPGARVTLHALEAYAHARIQAEGLSAAARLGFLDIVSGGGEMDFCFDIGVNFTPDGPVSLFDLRGTALNDAGSIDPAFTFAVNEREEGCNGLILRGITISGNFDVQPPEAAYILINFADNFDFPGDLLDPAMYVVELVGDFGDLIAYPDLTFDLLLQLLFELAAELEARLDTPIFTRKIPFLDVSLKDILSFGDIFGELALRVQDVGANSIQNFVDLVNELLRELVAPVLSYSGVSLVVQVDGRAVDGIFQWDIFFEGAVAQDYVFTASPGGSIELLVDVQAQQELTFEVLARADIRLGVDLSNPAAPQFLIFDETEIRLEFLLDATAEFMAAIGPIGLFVGPGHIRIDNGEEGGDRAAAHAHWTLNQSVPLAQTASALQLDIQGVLDALLPLYFPVTNHLGDLGLTFDFTQFNQGTYEIAYTVPELDFAAMDFFGSLGDSIELFFLTLEQFVEGQFALANLPFIGAQLQDVAVFLLDIRAGITAAFNAVTLADGSQIANLLTSYLGSLVQSAVIVNLQKPGEHVDQVEVQMTLGGQEVFASGGFAFDLGLPLLGFDLEAGLDVVLDWEWTLHFGVSRTHGFYLLAEEGVNELSLALSVTLAEGSSLTGVLGILFFSAEVNQGVGVPATGLSLNLGMDFTPNSANRLGLNSLLRGQGVDITLNGQANLHLVFELGFAGSSGAQIDSLPSFVVDFDVEWHFINASLSAGLLGEVPDVRFSNMYLDLGSFIDDFLRPIVDQIDQYLEPIRPVVNLLNTRISPLSWGPLLRVFDANGDGKVTLRDLAQLFGTISPGTDAFLDAVTAVLDLVQILKTPTSAPSGMAVMGESRMLVPIDLGVGGFSLLGAGVDVRNTNVTTAALAWGSLIPQNDMESLFDLHGKGGLYNRTQDAQFKLLILDPANLLKMLLGHDIEFFQFSPPSLDLQFRFVQSIPVWAKPRVDLVLLAGVGMRAQVTFGYDSSGIRRYLESGDPADVFGGFYVLAGRDRPLVTAWGEIGGGASVSFGVRISAVAIVRVQVSVSLFDPGRGRIYFSQIRPLVEMFDLPTVVDCLFEIGLAVTGRIEIKLAVWFPVIGYRNVLSKTIGPVNLLGPYFKAGGGCITSQIPDRLELNENGTRGNDMIEDAADLGYAPGIHLRGVSTSHYIDVDWYRFELPQQDDLTIELRGDPRHTVRLYDHNENLIAFVEGNPSANGTKRIHTSMLAAGIYYIQVMDLDSRAIAAYELDIVPGRRSTRTLYYVASEQSASPNVHSFYALATGNDAYEQAGRSPERPAATLQYILDTYALVPGDIVLVDAGHYTEYVTLGLQHTGFFVLGASRERYENLAESVAFGSIFASDTSGTPTLTVNGATDMFIGGLVFEGGLAIELRGGAAGNHFENLSIRSAVTGVQGAGATPDHVIERSEFVAVEAPILLPAADRLILRDLHLTGAPAQVERSGTMYDTFMGTAMQLRGEDMRVERVYAERFLVGVRADDFDLLRVDEWTSSGVFKPFDLRDGGTAEMTNLHITMIGDDIPDTFSFHHLWDNYALHAQRVNNLSVTDMIAMESPPEGNLHSYAGMQGMLIESVGTFTGDGITLARGVAEIWGHDVGIFTLLNSDLDRTRLWITDTGHVHLDSNSRINHVEIMADSVEMVNNVWLGRLTLDVGTGTTTLTGNEADYHLVINAEGAVVMTGNELYDVTIQTAASVVMAGNRVTPAPIQIWSDGNVTIHQGNVLGRGFIYIHTGGNVLIDDLDYTGFGISGDVAGNVTVTNSRIAILPAATGTPSRGIDFRMDGGAVQIDGNEFVTILVAVDSAGSVTVTDNLFHGGWLNVVDSVSLLLEDNEIAALAVTATLTAGAVVKNNQQTGRNLTLTVGAASSIINNSFSNSSVDPTPVSLIGPTDATMTITHNTLHGNSPHTLSVTGGAMTVAHNTLSGGLVGVLADGVVDFRDNSITRLGLDIVNGEQTNLLRNAVTGEARGDTQPQMSIDGLGTGTVFAVDNVVTTHVLEILRMAHVVISDNDFQTAGLRVEQSADIGILENEFVDGQFAILLDRVQDAEVAQNTVTGAVNALRVRGQADDVTQNVLIRDNVFSVGADTGIQVMNAHVSGIVIQDNQVFGYAVSGMTLYGHADLHRNEVYESAVGIRVYSTVAGMWDNIIRNNAIGLTGSGFLGNDTRAADQHNLVHDNTIGILAEAGAVIAFNRVYQNETGIQTASNTVVRHNLVYRNSGAGILVEGGVGTSLFNNTVYSPDGEYSVRVQGGAVNVNIRNNILWSESGVVLSVAYASDVGLQSDYNNLYATGSAWLGEWIKHFDDLLDWRLEVRQDLNSMGTTRIDPMRDEPQFVNRAANDYRITDSLATTVNSGDPGFSFAHEPGPGGLRINQGAYGDTALAAESPAAYIRLLTPLFYTDWPADTVRRIVWESFGLVGNVTVQLHEETLGYIANIATEALNNKPAQVDEQPASWGSFFWSPNANDVAGDDAHNYFLRLVAGAEQSESRETFVVPEAATQYFVAEDGDNRNTGTSAGAAKAILYPLLDNYDLVGTEVHVAAGSYIHVRDVVITVSFELYGPADGVAVFDRADLRAGRTGIVLTGASNMIIKDLTLTGGGVGLDVRNGSQFALIEDVQVTGHSGTQVWIRENSIRATLRRITIEGGGSHGVVVDGRMDALVDSVIRDNAGTGARLTDTQNVALTGNRFENNAGGGIWISNSVSVTTTVLGHADLSLELGNLFIDNGGNQVQVQLAGGAQVVGNTIYRTAAHSGYHSGRGVLSAGSPVLHNVIFGHATGIELTGTGTITGNRIYDHSQHGIRLNGRNNTVVVENVIYSSQYGIYNSATGSFSGQVYRNNLIYDISESAFYENRGNGSVVENNTFHVDGAYAVRLENAVNVALRNNIFSVGSSAVAIRTDATTQLSLVSDYNLFDLRGAQASAGFWNGQIRATFRDWRSASFLDARSLATDPLFVDPAGADGVIGYHTFDQDGRDDHFQLQSIAGSYHNASLVPVRDLITQLPVWLVPEFTVDAEHSPAIDRGDAASAFVNEPAFNGGFVNLGAFGNTALASHSPAEFVMLITPQGGELRPRGQTFDIVWRSHDQVGTVAIQLRRGDEVEAIIATGVANNGTYSWTVDAGLPVGDDYRVEIVRTDTVSGMSRSVFSVLAAISAYYVNDGSTDGDVYTTAVGDSGNTGLDPSSPRESIRAIIDTYELSPGDIIYVDAGYYELSANIILSLAESGIIIRGVEGLTILDRNNRAAGNYVFHFQGAADVTLENLTIQNAYRGIYAASGQVSGLTVRDSRFIHNGNAGIYLEANNPGLVVEDSYFEGANVSSESLGRQTYGIYLVGPSAVIRDSIFFRNDVNALRLNLSGTLDEILIEGNTISGSTQTRVSISGANSGSVRFLNNTVTGGNTGLTLSGSQAVAIGNTVVLAGSTGINASSGARVEDNTVSGITSGVGIRVSDGASARFNYVSGNQDGIRVEDALAEGNIVTGNSRYGIHFNGGTLLGNTVTDSQTGLYGSNTTSAHHVLIFNNVVYGNSGYALLLDGAGARARIYNNTLIQEGEDTVTIWISKLGAVADLRGNIIVNDGGVALKTAVIPGEDYNLYDLRNDATAFELGPQTFTTLVDWFFATMQGARSMFADPLFVDEAAADFRVQPGSPTINAADPDVAWVRETGLHGGRANIGAEGNTAAALPGDALTVAVLTPHDWTKWSVGTESWIEFLASGYGGGQSAAWFNAGSSSIGQWIQAPLVGSVTVNSISETNAINLSHVVEPAPEWVYRQYHSITTRADYRLSVPEGQYRLRLHFIHALTHQSSFGLDVLIDGQPVLPGLVVEKPVNGNYSAAVVEIDVTVLEDGLDGLLSLVRNSNAVLFAGYEWVRLYADAPAGSFTVEVSTDEGNSFEVVATGVELDLRGIGRVAWTPDAATTGRQAIVRVTSEGTDATSGVSSLFQISPASNVYYINDDSTTGDVYTTAAGSHAHTGTSPDQPMLSLQALLAAYAPGAGDIIYIDTGTYLFQQNLILTSAQSGLTIIGAFDAEDPAAVTVLNRNNRASGTAVFEMQGAADVTFEHLTLQNAHRAILAGSAGAPNLTVRNSSFLLNGDAGIRLEANNPGLLVEDSYFAGNGGFQVEHGAQSYGVYTLSSSAVIRNNVFVNNNTSAVHINPSGAGIHFEVRDNTISGSGTGISVSGLSAGVARIDDNVVTGRANSTGISISGAGAIATGNTVTAAATGIRALEGARVIDSVSVHGNTTGIRLERDAVAIGNRVYNNTDGIVGDNHLGAMRIEGNEVFDNSRYGISLTLGAVIGNVLYGNATGIYVPQMNGSHLVQITHNLIYGSTGQAVWINGSNSRVVLINNTFVQDGAGRATLRADAALQIRMRNNILVNEDGVAVQVATAAAGSFTEDYNLYDLRGDAVPFQWGGVVYGDQIEWFFNTGNGSRSLLADAQFVDEAESDYRLQASSPAIDAGDPAFGWLFEAGDHGGRVNMGAFGNTASAVEGALPAIWVISPYDLTKWMQDGEATIEFLASGFGTSQSAAWYNAGADTIGSWLTMPASTGVSTGTINISNAIDRSQVMDPAPEAVYRQYHSIFNTRADYELALPAGEYRLRLHFISIPTWRDDFRFDVELNGETVLEDVAVVDDPANPYRVAIVEIHLTAGEGEIADLLSLVATTGTVYFAGLEVVRLYDDAPAGLFTVEVSTDEGATFQTVATGVELDLRGMGRVTWIPDASTVGREAVVRVTAETVANLSAVSPSFLIANSGNIYYVNNDSTTDNVYTTAPGNNMNSGKDPASPLGSLEAVFNTYEVGAGDIIYVDTGVYALSGNLLLRAQHSGLTIVGAVDPDNPAARTVFDRGLRTSGAYAFDLYEVTNITLRHLEVTGAHTGIYIWIPSSAALGADQILLDHVRVFENTSFGMWVGQNNKHIEVRDSRFEGTGGSSDPLRQHVGLYTISDTLSVFNSVFIGNYNTGIQMASWFSNAPDYHVAGTLVEGSQTGISGATGTRGVIENSIVRNNSNYGIYAQGTFSVRDSHITGNGHSATDGAGIYSYLANSQILNNVILDNRVGVRVYRQSAIIADNVIGQNERGIHWGEGTGEISNNRIYGNDGHGIWIPYHASIVIRNNQIYSNQIGIENQDNNYSFSGTIENNVLYDHAEVAIRIARGSGTFRVVNNTIYEANGTGIALLKAEAARVSNNIVWVDAGFGISIDAISAGKVISDFNLFYNTGGAPAFVGEWGVVAQKSLADWQTASGLDANSLFADPLFFDRNGADDVLGYRLVDGFMVDGGVDDNFHLLRNSPAIDRGVTLWSSRADHEGDARMDDPGTVNVVGDRYVFEVLEESLFDASRGAAQEWTHSTLLRSLPLGFDFPYYDGLHDQVHLSMSGLLGFLSSTTSSIRTGDALIGMYRFTPLWAAVNIGTAGLDIFVCDAIPGELYIRWEARRDSPHTSVPVRFAVLIKNDGTIRFDYGIGNTGMTPVVGISYGNSNDYLFIDGYHESNNLSEAPSVLIRVVPGIVDIGAYEFKGDSTDETPPLITATVPEGIGDGSVARALVEEIVLSFSEAIDSIDARSPHSFELLRDVDGNGVFDSADEGVRVLPIYDSATHSIRLVIEGGALPEGFYRLRVRASNVRDVSGNELDGNENGVAGGDYIRTFTVEHPPVTLIEAIVNDGDEQRSMVTSVTVVFDSEVDGRATAERLRIYSHTTGQAVAAQVTWDAPSFSARITFPSLPGGSVPNGQYTLFVDAADFEDAVLRPLDANGDGEAGGVFEFEFHRLFGDTTGNRIVDNLDVLRFRQTLNRTVSDPDYDARFDVSGEGSVGAAAGSALLGAIAAPVVVTQSVPVIVLTPPAVTLAPMGDTVEFRVHVLAPVPVTIVWFRGGTEIARGISLFQLMLTDLSSADFGTYRILALTDWLERESDWFELLEDVG